MNSNFPNGQWYQPAAMRWSRCLLFREPDRGGSALGVVREALPVDHHAGLAADDPCVVPGRDHGEVARAELRLLPVVHDDLHPAGYEVAHVRRLAAFGLRDRFDVLGPLPARLERCPADGARLDVDEFEFARAGFEQARLLRRVQALADHFCYRCRPQGKMRFIVPWPSADAAAAAGSAGCDAYARPP